MTNHHKLLADPILPRGTNAGGKHLSFQNRIQPLCERAIQSNAELKVLVARGGHHMSAPAAGRRYLHVMHPVLAVQVVSV